MFLRNLRKVIRQLMTEEKLGAKDKLHLQDEDAFKIIFERLRSDCAWKHKCADTRQNRRRIQYMVRKTKCSRLQL